MSSQRDVYVYMDIVNKVYGLVVSRYKFVVIESADSIRCDRDSHVNRHNTCANERMSIHVHNHTLSHSLHTCIYSSLLQSSSVVNARLVFNLYRKLYLLYKTFHNKKVISMNAIGFVGFYCNFRLKKKQR